ncbi:MAG: hypothetical protein JWQ02_2292, partial [Capsulimonas sp.]|nr:hypothetical protein [Capsulimonas sp.]
NLIPIAQRLKNDATVLIPHDIRVSPCGYFIQWRGRRVIDSNLRIIAFKGHHSIGRSLREFILLSGEPSEIDFKEAGKVEKDLVFQNRVVNFVRQWGPLNLYPETHSADTLEDEDKNGPWRSEHLTIYRRHARCMWGLLAVAARIHCKEEPSERDWRLAADDMTYPDPKGAFGKNEAVLATLVERQYFGLYNEIKLEVNIQNGLPILALNVEAEENTEAWNLKREEWIDDLVITARKKSPTEDYDVLWAQAEKEFRPKDFRPSKLLNFLILQLMSTISKGLFLCLICMSPYYPTRKPRSENHFCDACKDIGHRNRSKASYERRRQINTLAKDKNI